MFPMLADAQELYFSEKLTVTIPNFPQRVESGRSRTAVGRAVTVNGRPLRMLATIDQTGGGDGRPKLGIYFKYNDGNPLLDGETCTVRVNAHIRKNSGAYNPALVQTHTFSDMSVLQRSGIHYDCAVWLAFMSSA